MDVDIEDDPEAEAMGHMYLLPGDVRACEPSVFFIPFVKHKMYVLCAAPRFPWHQGFQSDQDVCPRFGWSRPREATFKAAYGRLTNMYEAIFRECSGVHGRLAIDIIGVGRNHAGGLPPVEAMCVSCHAAFNAMRRHYRRETTSGPREVFF